jgi:ATP:corrinoid adenosyltransferase
MENNKGYIQLYTGNGKGKTTAAKLIKSADLVTEMKETKHYYNKGIQARKGIEF